MASSKRWRKASAKNVSRNENHQRGENPASQPNSNVKEKACEANENQRNGSSAIEERQPR